VCELDGDMVPLAPRNGDRVVARRAGGARAAPARPLRRVGDPARELAELSHDLDLLVIGTRGRAPLRRALTDSVSRKLIATTRCPLLTVPSQAAAACSALSSRSEQR